MSQLTQGTITAKYLGVPKEEKALSFSFRLRGVDKMSALASLIKKVYKNSFFHDFHTVLSAEVK